ncbi:MAG: Mrp/NBP35 family ATP-binding protein [Rikenellaceae bacterium]|jgi:ATP-binding protein involved in chromosome partitioning|nr:Mrp/NBP35 family ATP-binding protein [Rikenellaceae bacterium]
MDILNILREVIHPETGMDVVSSGIIDMAGVENGAVRIVVKSLKRRDPFLHSIERQCREAVERALPQYSGRVVVETAGLPKAETAAVNHIKYTVAVASGKGGVGKSTVACNMAAMLAEMGYSVGLLDADIYGPSQPAMFDVADYRPEAGRVGEMEMMIPALKYGVKLMSIGFFISPNDALLWRGAMATGALKQMIEQTLWGELDFLLIDLPPGTGDIHLTVVQELKLSGAVIVSTPQAIAVADVVRGVEMFRSEKVAVPVLGVIENMAWFTPEELPDNRYYIFGRGGAQVMAEREGIELLGQIPVVQGVVDSGDGGRPSVLTSSIVASHFRPAVEKIVEKLKKSVNQKSTT